ncbi:MAG: dethiobiotin synthase, partial [Candidatus Melainabacteria bacterium]|nr:dethiobiotin synthase [Candidatus Melainabacteria bacterium]
MSIEYKFPLSTQLSLLSTIFITGTDTGVGKSIFSAYLALQLKAEGKQVAISKPIQTGNPKDTDYLTELTANKIPIFNTYSFELPAAPSVSAQHENRTVDIKKIIFDIKKLEEEFDVVIVEGIGGIAVPLRDQGPGTRDQELYPKFSGSIVHSPMSSIQYLVADLIKDLNYPIVVVCRPSLGTINHSVLTIEFAKQKGLNVLGFIISGFNKNSSDKAELTAPDEIEKITNCQCLVKIPYLTNIYHSL